MAPFSALICILINFFPLFQNILFNHTFIGR
jgi:hypothetical protein